MRAAFTVSSRDITELTGEATAMESPAVATFVRYRGRLAGVLVAPSQSSAAAFAARCGSSPRRKVVGRRLPLVLDALGSHHLGRSDDASRGHHLEGPGQVADVEPGRRHHSMTLSSTVLDAPITAPGAAGTTAHPRAPCPPVPQTVANELTPIPAEHRSWSSAQPCGSEDSSFTGTQRRPWPGA